MKNNSKIYNTGTLYEFFVRELGLALVERDQSRAHIVAELIESSFGDGTSLGKELEFYQLVQESRGIEVELAKQIVEKISKESSRLNIQGCDRARRELSARFAKKLQGFKHDDDQLFENVSLFIRQSNTGRLSEAVQVIMLGQKIAQEMSRPAVIPEVRDSKPDTDLVNEARREFKSVGAFTPKQKKIFDEYVRFVSLSDRQRFVKVLKEERDSIARCLIRNADLDEIRNDPVMTKRFLEAAEKLSKLDFTKPDARLVEELLLFHNLTEELES